MPEKIDFFEGQRRKLELLGWQPLRNEQDEKRIRFDFLMPLTGEIQENIPAFCEPAYAKMDVEGSAIKDVDLSHELEEITLEAYATPKSRPMVLDYAVGLDEAEAAAADNKRKMLLTHCTLRNFKLVRVTRDKQALVALQFSLTTKSGKWLCCFAHDYHGKTFFVEFSHDPAPGQVALPSEAQMKLATPCPFPRCTLAAEHEGDHDIKAEPLPASVTGRKPKGDIVGATH